MDRCEEWYVHEINCCKERLKEYGNIWGYSKSE
jgi:hypothetical protein